MEIKSKKTNKNSKILKKAEQLVNYNKDRDMKIFKSVRDYLLSADSKLEDYLLLLCNENIDSNFKQELLFNLIGNDNYHDYSGVFFSKIFEIDLDLDRCVNLKTVLNKVGIEVTKKEGDECVFVVKKGKIEQEIRIPDAGSPGCKEILNQAIIDESTSLTFLFCLKPEVVFDIGANTSGGDKSVKYSFFKLICTCISVYVKANKENLIKKAEDNLENLINETESEISDVIEDNPEMRNNIRNNNTKSNNIETRCRKLKMKLKSIIDFAKSKENSNVKFEEIKEKFKSIKKKLKNGLKTLKIIKDDSVSKTFDQYANSNRFNTNNVVNNSNMINNTTYSVLIDRANGDITDSLKNIEFSNNRSHF